jgi:hypothetical protein
MIHFIFKIVNMFLICLTRHFRTIKTDNKTLCGETPFFVLFFYLGETKSQIKKHFTNILLDIWVWWPPHITTFLKMVI